MNSVNVGNVKIAGNCLVGLIHGHVLKITTSVPGGKQPTLILTNNGEDEITVSRTRGKQNQKKVLKPGEKVTYTGFEHIELHGTHGMMIGAESFIIMA